MHQKSCHCNVYILRLCWSVLYTQRTVRVCLCWERDPSSAALSEVYSILVLVKKDLLEGFYLSPIEGLRTEVVHWADCRLKHPVANCDL